MNAFEVFGLPVRYAVDKAALRQTWMAHSRALHPDFYTQASPQEQAEALRRSSEVNAAFKLLNDDSARLEHLLELKGVWVAGQTPALPPDFLMEMMDINEAVEDVQMSQDTAKAAELALQINQLADGFSQEIALLLAVDAPAPAALAQAMDLHLRRKYVLRLKQALAKVAG